MKYKLVLQLEKVTIFFSGDTISGKGGRVCLKIEYKEQTNLSHGLKAYFKSTPPLSRVIHVEICSRACLRQNKQVPTTKAASQKQDGQVTECWRS